jgi:ABC-2 type transport system permease protein
MSARSTATAPRGNARRGSFVQQLHILRVIAGVEYKLKYSESLLGYVWSIAKPLAMFAVLYTVFSRFFKLNVGFAHYSIYLLIGIVLWSFFVDGTTVAMASLVTRSSLLRKLAFPHIVLPLSVTISAAMTFLVNLLVIGFFVGANQISPQPDWLLLPFLLFELMLFTFAVGLVLAALFVRLRDVGQIWELVLQLLFFASPIIYPIGFLPPWAKPIAFISPVVQVMQDVRAVIVGGPQAITVADIYGTAWAYLVPIGFCGLTLAFGLWLFRRESPWFAERI